MEILTKIKELLAVIEADTQKFYEKGNKSAATRARTGLQDLKKLAQELRIDIQEKKKA
jgi:hypothetical protein